MKQNRGLFSVLFLAPASLLFLLFFIVPVFFSVYYSMTEWDAVSKPEFSAFSNFASLWRDADYWTSMRNTLWLVVMTLTIKIPVALILAYLLLRVKRGFKFFRTVYFLPVVIAPMAIGLMFSLIYSESGMLNQTLDLFGLSFLQQNWLSDPDIVLFAVSAPQVWQNIGLFFVIFLAALQGIPNETFESAEIDGASSTRTFFSIAVPMLWDVMQVVIILGVTGALKMFDHAWAITQGGPGVSSAFASVYMFMKGFGSYEFGYASAISVTIAGYALAFTIVFKKFFSGKDSLEY
ncbi:carbohydrate ABC transporter permease [Cohnella thailandensis]|uniref:Sugar ABC transporter permease n=1 Tax=Cohnella thailandensis TaxID=557557 RepID=A0A841T5F7_9BACL|nr:sugar ABC transporter permease [Cohnella thailandensis]MBB6637320.1 sugar ABC transporter permease [Cohnella thailandensis]MBP1976648.1 raffinose/stachyose/melibiose transport system permease protein [Cohnella thailandensis]